MTDRKNFIFKLGKLPPIIDKRTIKLVDKEHPERSVLRLELLPPLPETYDIDESLGGIEDNFVFNNSKYGDCVIAARAHHTLRFEKYEQGVQIPITDEEVVNQYFKETGSPDRDTGLVLLTSLKRWRNEGWEVGGKTYTIYAFASVDWHDRIEVKHCIHLLNGINFGMVVYQKDIDQFRAGEGWRLTDSNGSFQGRHGVYGCQYKDSGTAKLAELLAVQAKENGGKVKMWIPQQDIIGYTEDGIWIMTWGVKQFATWEFFEARCDECYTIVDNKDIWMGDDSPVDVEKLDRYLEEITGQTEDEPPDNPGCSFPWLRPVKKAGKFMVEEVRKMKAVIPG